MNYRVYISASTQDKNIGVLNYGTEQDNMHELADLIKYYLETQKELIVFRNMKNWTLEQTVKASNELSCKAFIDLHSNADSNPKTAGTEVFYNWQFPEGNGHRLSACIYKYVTQINKNKPRGVLPDNTYIKHLYVIQNTLAPATLVESFFHSNPEEVKFYLENKKAYAKAIAMGIVEYLGLKWVEKWEAKTWEQALKSVSINGDDWISKIIVMRDASRAEGNQGVYEILQYLPELIEKLINFNR